MQVWLIPIADERVDVQVKLWDPLRTRAIPERFWGDDSRRGAVSSVLSFIFTFTYESEARHCIRHWSMLVIFTPGSTNIWSVHPNLDTSKGQSDVEQKTVNDAIEGWWKHLRVFYVFMLGRIYVGRI